jgi:hypothetical protein
MRRDVMVLESERVELRDRMKRWMRAQSLDRWEDFGFSTPHEAWKVDLRAFRGVLLTERPIQIAFPQRLRLAFQDADLERLIAVGRSREMPWLPRALSIGLDAQQSRTGRRPGTLIVVSQLIRQANAASAPHPCSAVYFQHGVVLPTNCPTTDGTKFETPSGALILGEPARYRT